LQQTREASLDTGAFEPVSWYELVVILQSRKYTELENGKQVTKVRTLTAGELMAIKNYWLIAARMIEGATEGRLRIITSMIEVADESERPYIDYGNAFGPAPDIIDERGWYDGVISVRPRVPSEAGRKPATIGCEAGPQGAALSDMFDDTDVNEYTM